MIIKVIDRLNYIIDCVPNILLEIDEEELSAKPSPKKWSKKEILGHLIDSATNNHHRFVRGQIETNPEIIYDQNIWNKLNYYQEIESKQIIEFWKAYNTQLVEIIKRIPIENLERKIRIGEKLLTIEFLIDDYVDHLEHHLKQVFDFEQI